MPRVEIPAKYLAEFRSQSESLFAKLDLTSGRASAQVAQAME
jgi:hypothetical protein